MKRFTDAARHLVLFIGLAIAAETAFADTYNIEMVIFERPGNTENTYWPATSSEPNEDLAVGSITELKAGPRSLEPVAYTLRQQGMVILDHLSWYQAPAGRNSHDWYRIDGTRLSGLVRLTQGRELHLDTDLVLRDGYSPNTYRIQQHRRLRSGELHYLDHPRLGIIVRAVRIDNNATSVNRDLDAGEPKPAEPRS